VPTSDANGAKKTPGRARAQGYEAKERGTKGHGTKEHGAKGQGAKGRGEADGRRPDRTQPNGPARRDTAGAVRMFATCNAGLGGLLSQELAARHGVTVRDNGFDGRVDVVLFEADASARRSILDLRLSEDVFVEVGRTLRAEGDRPAWISGRLWRPERVRRALDARATVVRPAPKRSTYRVIVRVLQERSFLRTELRREFSRAVERDQPEWRFADPAQLEVWVAEYQPGRLLAGIRLSDVRMRQHDGRAEERLGALRPTVAAAMVARAGEPKGLLVDPCCGSGTILAEALAIGWQVRGTDIDPAAVATARYNVPEASIEQGDARATGLADGSVSACVSNLPFGQQYTVDATVIRSGGPPCGAEAESGSRSMDRWLRDVLGEMARVTVQGGRIALLAPSIPRTLLPPQVSLTERHPLRLLGTKTTLWVYNRH
jgi:23S rRNA G2445 N2-methylase RlmL